MTIGLLTADLLIETANSLKDKRQVLKSLLAHLRSEFNISAAEVGDNDIWRRATIAIVTVANDVSFVHQVLDKVEDHIENDLRVELARTEIEIL